MQKNYITVKNILLIFVSLPVLCSCRNFSFTSYIRGESVASVGENELYDEDFMNVLPIGVSAGDSTKIVNAFIDSWIKNQIKVQIAEQMYGDDIDDINKMVNDYRNSLLIYKFENEYIRNNLGTTVTRSEIDDYYLKNRNEFILPAAMTKATAVKIPNGFRQESTLRTLARTGKADNLQDIVDIAIKNDLEYIQFTTWTDYNEIISFMPRLSTQLYSEIQKNTGFYEVSEGGFRYMLIISDILPEGGIMPINMASAMIRMVIIGKRRTDLLKNLEDSIYKNALKEGKIYLRKEIYDTIAATRNE